MGSGEEGWKRIQKMTPKRKSDGEKRTGGGGLEISLETENPQLR